MSQDQHDAGFDALRSRLVGLELPGGEFRVSPHERWISHHAMQATGGIEPPLLHPAWIILGGLRGMGMTTDDLVRLADADPEGVLFGETSIEQVEALRADVTYVVCGRIVDLVRRQGRRAGVFDALTFRLEIRLPDEHRARASCSQTFILKRDTSA